MNIVKIYWWLLFMFVGNSIQFHVKWELNVLLCFLGNNLFLCNLHLYHLGRNRYGSPSSILRWHFKSFAVRLFKCCVCVDQQWAVERRRSVECQHTPMFHYKHLYRRVPSRTNWDHRRQFSQIRCFCLSRSQLSRSFQRRVVYTQVQVHQQREPLQSRRAEEPSWLRVPPDLWPLV